jgi:hypothetical protein
VTAADGFALLLVALIEAMAAGERRTGLAN